MGIEIYKGIERAIERECNEHALRIVNKELAFYETQMGGVFAPIQSQKALRDFKQLAVQAKARQLVNAVTEQTMELVTSNLRNILKEN